MRPRLDFARGPHKTLWCPSSRGREITKCENPLEKARIRILLVDDYAPWREVVCSTLEQRSEFQIVGEIANGVEATEKAQEFRPDLVLLDVGLPGLNGI